MTLLLIVLCDLDFGIDFADLRVCLFILSIHIWCFVLVLEFVVGFAVYVECWSYFALLVCLLLFVIWIVSS